MAEVLVAGLKKTFPGALAKANSTVALNDVNLKIDEGEFVSIIGPSGCGKTTLLRIIAGLETADHGEVRVNGVEVHGPGPDRAMVFQQFALLPWKTAAANVEFALRLARLSPEEIKERTARYLELVGMEQFHHHYPHQLSGGMQQRVGLARALAVDPDILLMDEPFGAVDAQQRQLLQEELLRICDDTRKTVVFVTHDLDEAIFLSTRVVLLSPHPGRVRSIFQIDLPPRRWEYDARGHDVFLSTRREIWQLLRSELIEEIASEWDPSADVVS